MNPAYKTKPTYWTLERCQDEAFKYDSRSEWQKKSFSSYAAARRTNSLDICCSHMVRTRKPHGYWTSDRCKEEALKYSTRTQWARSSNTSYLAARFMQMLDECCQHMVYSNKRWEK